MNKPLRLPRRGSLSLLIQAMLAGSLSCAAGGALAQQGAAAAANASVRSFDLPAGPLEESLTRFARQAGVTLSVDPALTRGRQAPALSGRYSVSDGLGRLLAGSGLVAVREGEALVVRAAPAAAGAAAQAVEVLGQSVPRDGGVPIVAGGQVSAGGRVGLLGNGDLFDVPVSIIGFTSEFRENTQALSASDMLKYAVSTQTPQAGPMNTTDVLYVRGFNIGTFDGTFDGLPGLLGRMPPAETVERVELLYGPNTFMNGQPSSVGGNINIVPKRAGDKPIARLGLNAMTRSIFGASVDVGQRFGPDGAFGVRVNAAYGAGDTELQNGERRSVPRAVSLDYRQTDLKLTLDYMGNNRRLPAENWFVMNPGVAVPDAGRADRNFRQPWTVYQDQWDTVMGRAEWTFTPGWTVSAAYGYMWTTVERFSQVSEVIDDAGDMQDAWGGTLGQSKQKRSANAGELVLRGVFALGESTHRLRLGVSQYGDRSGYNAVYSSTFIPFASNIYRPVHYPKPNLGPLASPSVYDTRTDNRSLFVADEIGLIEDRLRITLGVRRVQFETEYRDASTGAWSGNPALSKWSPAVGLLFKAQPWLTLYANRLEALDPGYRVEPPATNAGQVLPPLPADQYEVGIKADLGDFAVTAAYFDIDKPSYFLDPVTGIEDSNGRQVNRGLELSLFGDPMRGLHAYTSFTYIDPKMKQTPGGTYDGMLAVSAARYLASGYLDWDVPGAPGLGLMGGFNYNGSVYNDEANTQKLPSWVRFDAGLRYRMTVADKPLTLRLVVDNLADKKYWVSERGTVYMAPGRTVALAASVDL